MEIQRAQSPSLPQPNLGVGKFARSRRTWNAEIAGWNPAAQTTSAATETTISASSR